MNPTELNPEFLKFPEDILQKLIERVKGGDASLILMTKKEIEKELEAERKRAIEPVADSPSRRGISSRLDILEALFDFQVSNLLTKEFPKHAGMSEEEFLSHILPLKEKLPDIADMGISKDHISFIIIVGEKLLSLEKKIPLMEVDEKKGFTTLDLSQLKTAKGVEIPESMAYLAVDVENGKVMLGKRADEAVKRFKEESRSPLMAKEGVAVILQHPEILKDHSMNLPGSRLGDDDVVDLWLGEGGPRLDRSWAHVLRAGCGSASCGSRVGP